MRPFAHQVWKMSSADLCEIARNGVLHSGFPHACKKHWVAEEYWRPGPDGNDIHKTNVPNLRLRFRCGGGGKGLCAARAWEDGELVGGRTHGIGEDHVGCDAHACKSRGEGIRGSKGVLLWLH